jgi:putative restriction endonuclease
MAAERSAWTREQLLVALNLYSQLPFGKLHHANPNVIRCAELIGRSPNALAMKLTNFASLDPAITSTGRTGLANVSNADKELWAHMESDWNLFAKEAEQAATTFGVSGADAPELGVDEAQEASDYRGDERETQVTVRIGQYSFRRAVLSAYDYRCCISGLSLPSLLIASHIKPWSLDAQNRLNPRNGLCLSVLHDKAFDAGIITISSMMTVTVSQAFEPTADPFFDSSIRTYHGQKIHLPDKFQPDEYFLAYHREQIFME